LRRSAMVRTYLASAAPGPQLTQVLHESVFDQASTVNALGLPIELGDIFRVESLLPVPAKQQAPKPRHYVLLAQVCDISMRGRGAREPEIPIFVLHEFRGVAKNVAARVNPRFHTVGFFETETEEIWGVNFGARLAVPAIAIDATVYNQDGSSKIVLGHAETRHMAASWVNRELEVQRLAGTMITEHAAAIELLKDTKNIDAIVSRLAAATAGAASTSKGGVTAQINVAEKVVEYGLKRVGRLSSRVAASVAALAVSYDGRPGFEMDAAVAELADRN